jgi:hypothetical protein
MALSSKGKEYLEERKKKVSIKKKESQQVKSAEKNIESMFKRW